MNKVNKKKVPKLGKALQALVADFAEAKADARWENDQGTPTSAANANTALAATEAALTKRLIRLEQQCKAATRTLSYHGLCVLPQFKD